MTKIINILFEQLQTRNPNKVLKMDYNAIYGGYRIQRVLTPGTGEDFFDLSSRISKKEMEAYLRGHLKGCGN